MGYDTGLRVTHPLDAARTLPVFVANFVLMDYGTGAIFGCPAHDQRDLDFARKYGLPVLPVVAPDDGTPVIDDEGVHRPRQDRELGISRRAERRCRQRPPSSAVPRRKAGAPVPPSGDCATGASRGSATGGRRSR